MSISSIISQPFTLKNGTTIKNRLIKSAMAEGLGKITGEPKLKELETLYGTWAKGGIGLCITGNVFVSMKAKARENDIVIEDETYLASLKKWAIAASQNNSQCWIQINHPGKQVKRGSLVESVAPSAVPFRKDLQAFFAVPRELTEKEIKEIINQFATSASIVKKAGFNGVQIHAAHGYLISQFLSPHHNIRTDNYGGNSENRSRFLLEIYHAVREKVGPTFPIGVKLNSADFQKGGLTEEESMELIKILSTIGVDLIEISGGTMEAPIMTGAKPKEDHRKESTKKREAYFLTFAEEARKVCSTALFVTGGFQTAEGIAEAISSNAVDFVGLARLLTIEPEAPNKLIAGKNTLNKVKEIKVGIPFLDNSGLLNQAWYGTQLSLISKGKKPQVGLSPWKMILNIALDKLFNGKKFVKERAN